MATGKIGLYVHAPFCLKKCSYCAFTSIDLPEDTSGMCASLYNEFRQKTSGHDYEFQTFYAGGGTPTLLPSEFWSQLIGQVKNPFLQEVTVETNPAVLDSAGYSSLRFAGFNRISIGIQTFSSSNLEILGRIHSADEARDSLKLARKSGFRNISLDLMYGLPGQTPSDQKRDIEEALRFMPEHISAYDLTLEQGTPLGDKGEKASEKASTDMYHQLHEILSENGYIHYEVSSYALGENNRSIHNSSYWDGTPYLGIGPSAHSFTGSERSWNFADVKKYESVLNSGNSPMESREVLSKENTAHEILALGFRNINGVNLELLKCLGYKLDPSQLIATGLVTQREDLIIPSARGMLFADSLSLMAAELLEGV